MDPPHRLRRLCLFLAFAALASAAVPPTPAVGLHSHNDYERERPLLDALDRHAASIEADVHLVDGRLLVAHDADQVRSERTLEALYLEPLRERVRLHGGRVYPGDDTPLILLVDVKGPAEATYAVLSGLLRGYADLLAVFHADRVEPGAVVVIVSGNRDRAAMEAAGRRHAALDGRIGDLGGGAPVSLIPLVSDDWSRLFAWRGEGPMPAEERTRLRAFAEQARREGRLLRFWGTPARPEVWNELRAAGVGLIGTDDPAALRSFLDRP